MNELNNQIGESGEQARKWRRVTIAVILFSFAAGFVVATQYFARTCGYDAVLGFNIGGWYFPAMIVVWIIKWHSVPTLTEPLHLSAILGVAVAGGGTFIFMIASHIAKQSARGNAILHGSAHWANEEEVRRAGLLNNADGVYVGAWKDKRGHTHYLRDSGPAHVLCFAPTRSGKGVGLVLPTLLSWQHSTIVADLKGELWELTAGWRQEHAKNKVIRFEPGNPTGSAKWNPFDEIRIGTEYEFADVSDLSRITVDPAGKGLEDHWARTANDLLTGCIMHLLYKRKCEQKKDDKDKTPEEKERPAEATLTALDRMLADPNKPVAALFEEMKTYPHHGKSGDKPLVHPVVGSSAQKIMDKPDNERGSVISTAQSFLELYRDPTTAKNTASSDFSIADLMNYSSPVALYLITTPDNKDRLCPLLRIFINWFLTKSTTREALKFTDGRTAMSAKHRLLMMMDEFPSFGKLPQIASGLAFIGGYGIKAYLITQDLSQLYERHGKDESITSNCHVQVAFPPNKMETAKYLSDMLGTTTVKEEHYTTNGKRIALFNTDVTKSVNLTQRPLLTADETMTLPGAKKNQAGDIVEAGDMVVKVAGFAPIYGKQPLYFQDRIFLARAKLPAPKETDKIEKIDEEKADKNDEEVSNEASEVSKEKAPGNSEKIGKDKNERFNCAGNGKKGESFSFHRRQRKKTRRPKNNLHAQRQLV